MLRGIFMFNAKKGFIFAAAFFVVLLVLPVFPASASGKGGGKTKSSEVIVRRVDSNQMIRLRIFLDGKSQGTLNVGQTAVYKIQNGYHTIRVGFEDYQSRTTEVAQFTSYNSTHVFSVTDTSIVLVNEETSPQEEFSAPTPVQVQAQAAVAVEQPILAAIETPASFPGNAYNESSTALDNSIRSAFDKTTRNIKKKKKIAVINVDADNTHEGNFVLEELTLLTVNSPKSFVVIDRRMFDAYRAKNSIGLPTYDNDYMLRYIGDLMGADYVISGRLDGPGDLRRLRIKALEVSTGALVGDSSERL
jgi:hypothetical protein